jgi:predicted NUDIX family NTP pyrophosphohydrolase
VLTIRPEKGTRKKAQETFFRRAIRTIGREDFVQNERDNSPRQRGRKPTSAGILLYRQSADGLRVLLAHPGGPYFSKKDAAAWTIPKGLVAPGEGLPAAALREFEEEVGWRPVGELEPLGEVTLRSGKCVAAFSVRFADSEEWLLEKFRPGRFSMEWPPHSGNLAEFPEIDRIEFFSLEVARGKITPGQAPLLDRLVKNCGQ